MRWFLVAMLAACGAADGASSGLVSTVQVLDCANEPEGGFRIDLPTNLVILQAMRCDDSIASCQAAEHVEFEGQLAIGCREFQDDYLEVRWITSGP